MDFVTQYIETLQNALNQNHLQDARALVDAFHKTSTTYTADCYYLEAALCYYEQKYIFALLFAVLGKELDEAHPGIHELLSILVEQSEDIYSYLPTCYHKLTSSYKRLRIVIHENILDIMDYTAEQFHKAFSLLGHEVFIFHHNDFKKSAKEFMEFLKGGIDFTLIFNNIGLFIKDDLGNNLWDRFSVPCVNFLFDHPFYYQDTLRDASENAIFTCIDRNHVKYIKRFYPNIKKCFYMPLAGELLTPFSVGITDLQKQLLSQDVSDWSTRPIDVLYVGSLKQNFDMDMCQVAQKAFDFLIKNQTYTTEYALELSLKKAISLLDSDKTPDDISEGLDVAKLTFPSDICLQADDSVMEDVKLPESVIRSTIETYRYVDMNVNYYFRKKLIVDLVQSGIDVTVYGNGWNLDEIKNSPHFHYRGLTSQRDCLCEIRRSKFVLNNMTWFKDGTHDRVHNAMLYHTVCITDDTAYLRERFEDGRDLIFYSLDTIHTLPDKIKELLWNPEKAMEIAENGFQKAVLTDTWNNRALELLAGIFSE